MDTPVVAPPPAPAPDFLIPRKRSWGKAIALSVLVILLAVIAAAGYWYSKSSYAAFLNVSYLSGPFETRTLHQFGFATSKPNSLPVPGHIVDYARTGGTEVALSIQSNAFETIYKIQNGTSKTVVSDTSIKSSIAVSSDGSLIAYASRATAATTTNPKNFYDPNSWNIQLIKNSDAPKLIGTGYGPQFFARDGQSYLMYATEKGIHLVNLATNTYQDIPVSFGTPTASHVAVISSDGRYLLLPDVATGYALYSLTYTGTLATISPVGPLPLPTDVAAFKGDIIVSVSHDATNLLFRTSTVQNPTTILKTRTESSDIIFKLIP
jgi:hypothetical protein